MERHFHVRQDSRELPQTTALDAWGMLLISAVVWGNTLVGNRESELMGAFLRFSEGLFC